METKFLVLSIITLVLYFFILSICIYLGNYAIMGILLIGITALSYIIYIMLDGDTPSVGIKYSNYALGWGL